MAACGQNVLWWRSGEEAGPVGASTLQTPSGVSGYHLESSPAGGNPNSGTDHLGVAASKAFPFLPHKIAVFSQTADSAKH